MLQRLIGSVFLFQIALAGTIQAQEPLNFMSTQMNPPKEAHLMRTVVLRDAPHPVKFVTFRDSSLFLEFAVFLELAAGDGGEEGEAQSVSLLGALDGELRALDEAGVLMNLGPLLDPDDLDRVPADLANFSSNAEGEQFYWPWLQATYLMVANRKALTYLPDGAELNSLTYDQFQEWAEIMKWQTGKAQVGFPIGERGLMHRFLQGYAYPSFTGGTVRTFKGADAVTMWEWMREFWPNVSPRSLAYSDMSDPLLSNEVLVAWDHTARLLPALKEKPDEFIAFPAPIGPKGRGYMTVLTGLAIPVRAPAPEASFELLRFLLEPETQAAIMQVAGFFPVALDVDYSEFDPALASLSRAITEQASSANGIPTALPVGLKELSREFNDRYTLALVDIVLGGKVIEEVLAEQGSGLELLMTLTKAPCWSPDPKTDGPCIPD